jgi:hypothetical protein
VRGPRWVTACLLLLVALISVSAGAALGRTGNTPEGACSAVLSAGVHRACRSGASAAWGIGGASGRSASSPICGPGALAPLGLLKGRVFVKSVGDESLPRLNILWRGSALPRGCQGMGFRRSIAVAVRIKTRFSHGFIPIGRGDRLRQWLTFDRKSSAQGFTVTVAEGLVFRERLGCIQKALGRARYRLIRNDGSVARQIVRPFPLIGARCPTP